MQLPTESRRLDFFLAYQPLSMRGGQRKAIKAHQQSAPRVFRVESAQPYGWIVYLEGFEQTHHFMNRSLALMYARQWAKVNAPSVIQVVGLDGRVEHERTYRR